MRKRSLAVLLALLLVISLIPANVFAYSTGVKTRQAGVTYVASITSGGSTYYYETLKDAVADASNGDTIVLLEDSESETVINLSNKKVVILDLNGNQYTRTGKSAAFQIYNGACLIVKDTRAFYGYEEDGRMFYETGAINGNVSVFGVFGLGGELILESGAIATNEYSSSAITCGVPGYALGKVSIKDGVVYAEENENDPVGILCSSWGEVNITGGNVISQTNVALALSLSDENDAAKITVTGGRFSNDPSEFLESDAYNVKVHDDQPRYKYEVVVNKEVGEGAYLYKPWVADGLSYHEEDGRFIVGESTSEFSFEDVGSVFYYYEPVSWAVENGITTGATDKLFNPDGKTTRSQAVTFIWRAAGCPEPESDENPFVDLDLDEYYVKAVLWAVEKGITTGTTEGHFSPYDQLTRSHIVAFLYRYEQSQGGGFKDLWSFPLEFDDTDEILEYAVEPFSFMVMNEIVKGSEGKLLPNKVCTRAETVTFLYRYFNLSEAAD